MLPARAGAEKERRAQLLKACPCLQESISSRHWLGPSDSYWLPCKEPQCILVGSQMQTPTCVKSPQAHRVSTRLALQNAEQSFSVKKRVHCQPSGPCSLPTSSGRMFNDKADFFHKLEQAGGVEHTCNTCEERPFRVRPRLSWPAQERTRKYSYWMLEKWSNLFQKRTMWSA